MAHVKEAKRSSKASYRSLITVLILVVAIALAAWALVTVSTTSQVPSTDFVTLPNIPLSKTGEQVVFVSVSAITEKDVAIGMKGYLHTISGKPVAGATVYLTYHLRGAYRTQAATADQNGYFEARFPMNWTGWLPVTLTYFGDDQHQGLTQVFNVPGENL